MIEFIYASIFVGGYFVTTLIAVYIIGHLLRTGMLVFDDVRSQGELRGLAFLTACFWPFTMFWLLKPFFHNAFHAGLDWKPKVKAPPERTYPACVCNGGVEPCPPRPPKQGPMR